MASLLHTNNNIKNREAGSKKQSMEESMVGASFSTHAEIGPLIGCARFPPPSEPSSCSNPVAKLATKIS